MDVPEPPARIEPCCPGWTDRDVRYRFQYYHPAEGPILRYDNAHDDDELGEHHRHIRSGDDTEVEFRSIVVHVERFLREVDEIAATDAEPATDISTDPETDNRDTDS